jgi:hemoglobin
MISYDLILEIIEAFYAIAKKDIMIGYHFRVIDDFDEHIPRIADFWNLQLTGEMKDRKNLPYDLIGVHIPLKVNLGEIHRWEKLFNDNLEYFLAENKIHKDDMLLWQSHVNKFKNVLIQRL